MNRNSQNRSRSTRLPRVLAVLLFAYNSRVTITSSLLPMVIKDINLSRLGQDLLNVNVLFRDGTRPLRRGLRCG